MLDLIYDCDRVDTLVSTQPSTQSGPVAVLWPNWQGPGKMSPLSFHLRYTQSHTHTPVVGWVQQSGQGTGGWEVLADPASRACCSSLTRCSFPPCCSRSPPPTTSSSPPSSRQTPLLRTPASLNRGWCWRPSLLEWTLVYFTCGHGGCSRGSAEQLIAEAGAASRRLQADHKFVQNYLQGMG